DDALKVADHDGIWMRAVSGAKNIMSGANVGDPITHGFVNGFLEIFLSGIYGDNFSAEHFHSVDVQGLALAIDGGHVNNALQDTHGADGGGGDAVLACAGFGDDSRFAHATREQDLADGVINFVGASV